MPSLAAFGVGLCYVSSVGAVENLAELRLRVVWDGQNAIQLDFLRGRGRAGVRERGDGLERAEKSIKNWGWRESYRTNPSFSCSQPGGYQLLVALLDQSQRIGRWHRPKIFVENLHLDVPGVANRLNCLG